MDNLERQELLNVVQRETASDLLSEGVPTEEGTWTVTGRPVGSNKFICKGKLLSISKMSPWVLSSVKVSVEKHQAGGMQDAMLFV